MRIAPLVVAILVVSAPAFSRPGSDYKSIPAKWHFELSSTKLVGYKPGEHLIVSSIFTGTKGADAVERHGLEVKVEDWDRPFKTTDKTADGKSREELVVTLHKLADPHEMSADFDDTVWDNDKLLVRFAGTTILTRVN